MRFCIELKIGRYVALIKPYQFDFRKPFALSESYGKEVSMHNGFPTVMWICLFLLLGVLFNLNTAQLLADYQVLERGTVETNIDGTARLARMVRGNLTSSTTRGAPGLTSIIPPAPQTTIARHTFAWSQDLVSSYGGLTGTQVATRYQAVHQLGVLVSGVLVSDDALVKDRKMLAGGVLVSDG
jgi:hypothetical protein